MIGMTGMTGMMRKRRSITVVLALGLVLGACKNQGKDSDNPDELELPPETKVADTKGKDGSKAGRENKGKDEGKKPIQQQPKPPIVHPQDRDPKQEKSKMERSRITSAKAKQLLRGGQNGLTTTRITAASSISTGNSLNQRNQTCPRRSRPATKPRNTWPHTSW